MEAEHPDEARGDVVERFHQRMRDQAKARDDAVTERGREARRDRLWNVADSGWTTVALAIIVAWLGVWLVLPWFYPDPAEAGQLGDSFGLITSLFSGLTLLGAGYAVYLQRVELRETREQIREDRRLQRLSAELDAYNSLVQHHIALLAELEPGQIPIDNGTDRRHRDLVARYFQMTRVVLADIQHSDVEFDWKGGTEREKTRFRKYLLCRVAETLVLDQEVRRKRAGRQASLALLRELEPGE